MPLTPAHAAMAWPLSVLLRRVPLTALVIGTLSPDFEYLLRLAPRGEFSHSIAGVAFFCVPVSLTMWVLFEKYARTALARMLPSTIGEALRRARCQRSGSRAAEFALAGVGTVIGALSHLVWDSFTHASGWAVLRIQALAEPIHVGSFPGLPVYKLLQHGSTVGGLLVVVFWVRKMFDRVTSASGRADPDQSRRGWWSVAVLTIGSVGGAILNASRVLERVASQILGHAAVGSMAGLLLATIAVVIYSSIRDAGSPTRR